MTEMTLRERVDEQTRIRRALRGKGYSPLANVNKTCVIPKWPKIVVDDSKIEEWSDQLAYLATGVRIEGQMLALDMDIDDSGVLDKIWARLPDDLLNRLDAAPMRFGRGVKFVVFLRLREGETKVGRQISQGYAPPDRPNEMMRAEAFDSGKPRQMGGYGPHSHSNDGSIAVLYRWAEDVGDLTDTGPDDLPEVTRAEVETVLDTASSVMLESGWEYEVKTASGVVDDRPVFDISDHMQFVTAYHGAMGLEDLETLCESSPYEGVRLSASWLEGPSAQNTGRCIARLNPADGRLQIWESAAGLLHRPVEADLHGKAERLGQILNRVAAPARHRDSDTESVTDETGLSRLERLLAGTDPEKRLFRDTPEDEGGGGTNEEDVEAYREALVRDLLDRYAYWSDGRGYVVDVFGNIENAMTLGSFHVKMAPLSWTVKPKKGPEKEVNPADVWKKHPERAEVAGFRFLPDCRDRVAVRGGKVFINTWERPEWWDEGVPGNADAAAAFQVFLEHLIPDPSERDWFIMWLAAKVQKPWLPNCGVIMVAERQGTGRGTLFDMLQGVFGARHVNNVAAVQLIGGGSQAQYTDWMENALIVTCDEVLAGDDAGGAMAWKRREVYERLKALIDPRPRPMNIVRKGLPNNKTEVYASFLLATNNVNALPLSADDRRIAVVTNTAVPMAEAGDVMAVIEPWRHETLGFTEAFSEGVYAWLAGLDVSWSDVREAPKWMRGREEMLAANESDLDEVLENVLRRIEGDFVLGHHLRERLSRSIEANGLDNEIKGWWNKAQDILGRPNRLGWRRVPGRHRFAATKDSGSVTVASVFYRCEGPGAATWLETPPAERVALWRGGDSSLRTATESVSQRMRDSGIKPV